MLFEKYVLGNGDYLHWALAAWAEVEPDIQIHALDIGQDKDYRFNLEPLASLDHTNTHATAFVAWGPQFLNFRRLELMGEIKGRGLKMPPLICRGAAIAAGVSVGENCVVGAGAIIGAGSKIGFNSVIGAGCILGAGVQVGSSAWIADGVHLGSQVKVGANATLGRGVIVDDGVNIGRQAVLDQPGRRSKHLSDKNFINNDFPDGITITDYN